MTEIKGRSPQKARELLALADEIDPEKNLRKLIFAGNGFYEVPDEVGELYNERNAVEADDDETDEEREARIAEESAEAEREQLAAAADEQAEKDDDTQSKDAAGDAPTGEDGDADEAEKPAPKKPAARRGSAK